MGSSTIPQQVLTPISGVTTTTTSSAISLAGVRKCTLFYTRASGTTGNSTLTATVSADNTNFVAYNGFITNATNANTAFTTRVASLNLSTNTTGMLTMDMDYGAPNYWLKVISTNTSGTDDGLLTVKAVLEY